MRRFFGFALGVSALLLFGNTATAQMQGFPGLGITLSYPNYLPVFNQPEIPGTHRWGFGGPYYGGQHGTSQIANPSAPPFYFSTR